MTLINVDFPVGSAAIEEKETLLFHTACQDKADYLLR
jgi:ethanolamine ammonia-lyase small subunit